MPDKQDIENILSKLEQLYESRNSAEKLLIRIDEKLKTIAERGCKQGEDMNKELRTELTKKIEVTDKKIDFLKKIAGAATAIGVGIGYWFKKN